MEVTYAGLPVTFTKELRDPSELALNVSAVSYRITDEDGVEIVPSTSASSYVPGSSSITISIPSSANVLPASVAQALRQVEMTLTLASGDTFVITEGYVVRSAEPLLVGVNSFQTYTHAQMTALDVPRLTYWNTATEQQKTDALAQAAERIKRYRFRVCTDQYLGNQQNRLKGFFNGNLNDLTVDEFIALPDQFKRDLRKAQVAEAESILAPPNEYSEKREAGVILDEVGETKMAFSPSTVLKMAISKEALSFIGRYISYTMRVGR